MGIVQKIWLHRSINVRKSQITRVFQYMIYLHFSYLHRLHVFYNDLYTFTPSAVEEAPTLNDIKEQNTLINTTISNIPLTTPKRISTRKAKETLP